MSIVLDESILAIWYCKLSADFDLMWSLARNPDGGYKAVGRTRGYNSPDDPWDKKDRKRWFEGPVAADTNEAAIEWTRTQIVELATSFTTKFHPGEVPMLFELVRGEASVEQFADKLLSMPWAHSMKATKQ